MPIRPLIIRGRRILPIVQGGMGVGVSAHRLAGTVARHGALGTISSVDLRRHHPDLMRATQHCRDRATIDRANLVALDREIAAARTIAAGHGMLAVNVMRAVSGYADYVRAACASGTDAIVVGAGLPLDLPDLTADHPDVALIPILSDARGVQVLLRKWERRKRLPDAVIVEHPRYAGGHLGAASIDDIADPRFDFERAIPAVLDIFRAHGLSDDAIPIIPAGGINSPARVRELFALGARAVQLGTAFAVTEEGDAAPEFKAVLANASADDLVEAPRAPAPPARAGRPPWPDTSRRPRPPLPAAPRRKPRCTLHFDCLAHCGLRDGIAHIGQFCIDTQLAAALRGDVRKGLFFRGAAALPFGSQIRPVRDLIDHLLGGLRLQPA